MVTIPVCLKSGVATVAAPITAAIMPRCVNTDLNGVPLQQAHYIHT